MIVERAQITDAEEILKLQKLSYISEAEIINDFNIPPLVEDIDIVKKEFDSKIFLKLVIDGRIIGSARLHIDNGTCYIGRFIVHPEYQNKGIGTTILKEIEKMFINCKRFELFTGFRSERNLYLYNKVGYKAFKEETVNEKLKLIYLEKIIA